MIRLHQTCGAHTGRALTFDAGPIRCGRQPGNELAFDPNADLDASGFHAELVLTESTWRVKDTQSRNGTWLNGERIEEAILADGDEIEFGIGGPRVRVELSAPVASPARPDSMPAGPRPALEDRAARFPPDSSSQPVTRGVSGWLVALLGCSGLLFVGLLVGVGFQWVRRVPAPPPTATDAARIATAHAGALFVVLHRDSSGLDHQVCAGFAVRRDLIATSARCIYALQAATESGHHAFVSPPGGVPQAVSRMYRHPGMPVGATVGPDVGLLHVSGSAPALTTLAPAAEVAGLRDGAAVFVWAAAASGGGLRGGRVAAVDELHGAASGQLVRHELAGTAGSPIFDREGRVVAVHAGAVGPSASPGYGVRIDVLHELLAGL